MLRLVHTLQDLNFGQLMNVYREGNEENAKEQYPNEESGVALILAEQDFYTYLKESFFLTDKAFYAVYEEHGSYRAALRMEPYQDGWLLEALETDPSFRNKGYAKKLINSLIEEMSLGSSIRIYSHISKQNIASLAVHTSCGFQKILDHAVYIDGSVMSGSCTMLYVEEQGKRC